MRCDCLRRAADATDQGHDWPARVGAYSVGGRFGERIARPIFDSTALIERLKRGDIAAGLDVFDPEPIPADSEIIDLPNVFLTPHFSGRTGDEYPHFFRLVVDELERFFSGHETYFDLTPRSCANRQGDQPG